MSEKNLLKQLGTYIGTGGRMILLGGRFIWLFTIFFLALGTVTVHQIYTETFSSASEWIPWFGFSGLLLLIAVLLRWAVIPILSQAIAQWARSRDVHTERVWMLVRASGLIAMGIGGLALGYPVLMMFFGGFGSVGVVALSVDKLLGLAPGPSGPSPYSKVGQSVS